MKIPICVPLFGMRGFGCTTDITEIIDMAADSLNTIIFEDFQCLTTVQHMQVQL